MKDVLLLFLFLLSTAFTKAQTRISIVCDSTCQGNYRDCAPCRVVYYIEGVKTTYAIGLGKLFVNGYGIYTIEHQQLAGIPQRNINAISGIIAGVDSRNGQVPNIRGARQDGTAYYIDGIRTMEPDISIENLK